MSGDWIKVENSTPNKPEILRMARILGVHRDEAFGKAMRFWLWVDGISVDGRVDGVASTDIDAVVDAVGFSVALSEVGWAVFDDDKLVMTVPNFERHNGQSAKARGLKTKRQTKWRGKTVDAHVDAAPSTTASPEKRREEKRRIDSSKEESNYSPDVPDRLMEIWNQKAAEVSTLASVRKLTKDRRTKCQIRLKADRNFEATFREAVEMLPIPNTERFQWQPSFDWLIEKDRNALAVLEGKYHKCGSNGKKTDAEYIAEALAAADKLEEEERRARLSG